MITAMDFMNLRNSTLTATFRLDPFVSLFLKMLFIYVLIYVQAASFILLPLFVCLFEIIFCNLQNTILWFKLFILNYIKLAF